MQFGSWAQSSDYLLLKSNEWIGGARLADDPGRAEMKLVGVVPHRSI